MAISLATVGGKITAAFVNLLVTATNSQSATLIVPTSAVVAGAGSSETISSLGKITFTNATSLALNNCFVGYDNYRMIIDISSHSLAGLVQFRMRLAGVDDATAGAYISQATQSTGTTVTASTTTTSAANLTNASSALDDFIYVEVNSASLARPTRMISTYLSNASGVSYSGVSTCRHTLSTAYDGIDILPGAGAMNGTVRVYGWNNG
jgi:hypothetical protein